MSATPMQDLIQSIPEDDDDALFDALRLALTAAVTDGISREQRAIRRRITRAVRVLEGAGRMIG